MSAFHPKPPHNAASGSSRAPRYARSSFELLTQFTDGRMGGHHQGRCALPAGKARDRHPCLGDGKPGRTARSGRSALPTNSNGISRRTPERTQPTIVNLRPLTSTRTSALNGRLGASPPSIRPARRSGNGSHADGEAQPCEAGQRHGARRGIAPVHFRFRPAASRALQLDFHPANRGETGATGAPNRHEIP